MSDMKRRFTLYGFGFFIGILLVIFFLGGKNTSCNWLPNDRMLQIIRSKQINYSTEATQVLNTKKVDSADIAQILIRGEIDFSKSNVKNNPCRKYLINGNDEQKNIALTVQICDSIATIQKILIE